MSTRCTRGGARNLQETPCQPEIKNSAVIMYFSDIPDGFDLFLKKIPMYLSQIITLYFSYIFQINTRLSLGIKNVFSDFESGSCSVFFP